MAKKPKKLDSKVLTPLSIPCANNCPTCIQRVRPGDVVTIRKQQFQVAEKRACACVTTKGTILYCEDFTDANKRVRHLPLPRLNPIVVNLVAEFRI